MSQTPAEAHRYEQGDAHGGAALPCHRCGRDLSGLSRTDRCPRCQRRVTESRSADKWVPWVIAAGPAAERRLSWLLAGLGLAVMALLSLLAWGGIDRDGVGLLRPWVLMGLAALSVPLLAALWVRMQLLRARRIVQRRDARAGEPAQGVAMEQAVALDDQGRLDQGLPCVSCGYDLRTQPTGGACPECGAAVERTIAAAWLSWADPRWLGRLAAACRWLFAADLASLVLLGALLLIAAMGWGPSFNAKTSPGLVWLLPLGLVLIGWAYPLVRGVWLLASPEPDARHGLLRWCLRLLMLAGPLFWLAALGIPLGARLGLYPDPGLGTLLNLNLLNTTSTGLTFQFGVVSGAICLALGTLVGLAYGWWLASRLGKGELRRWARLTTLGWSLALLVVLSPVWTTMIELCLNLEIGYRLSDLSVDVFGIGLVALWLVMAYPTLPLLTWYRRRLSEAQAANRAALTSNEPGTSAPTEASQADHRAPGQAEAQPG